MVSSSVSVTGTGIASSMVPKAAPAAADPFWGPRSLMPKISMKICAATSVSAVCTLGGVLAVKQPEIFKIIENINIRHRGAISLFTSRGPYRLGNELAHLIDAASTVLRSTHALLAQCACHCQVPTGCSELFSVALATVLPPRQSCRHLFAAFAQNKENIIQRGSDFA